MSVAMVMMMKSAARVTMAVILLASSTLAFDPADLKKLKETNECIGCDLKGADLVRANLMGAILVQVVLRSANLMKANLKMQTFG
jgi:uncharacterized protein YjbI with pentapeptide repeats